MGWKTIPRPSQPMAMDWKSGHRGVRWDPIFLGGGQQDITIFIEQKGEGHGARFYSL